MHICSPFNRTTLKLFIAAGLVLGGIPIATVQAQAQMQDGRGSFLCDADNCLDVSLFDGEPFRISEWDTVGGSEDSVVAATDPANAMTYTGQGLNYSNAYSTPSAMDRGTPTSADVPPDMSIESLAAHPTCVVYDNGHRALIQGAALHDAQYGGPAAVAVEVVNFDGQHTLHALNAGDGGFFSLVVDVTPRIYAVRVAVAEQPDAMSRCKGTNVAVVSQ